MTSDREPNERDLGDEAHPAVPPRDATDGEIIELLHLGAELIGKNRPEEARVALERAFHLSPRSPKAQNLLGLVYFKLGLLEASKSIYDRLVDEFPEEPPLHVNLGLVLLRQGRLAEAERSLRRAIAIAPDHTRAHCYLGLVLYRRGDLALSREHFLKGDSPELARKVERKLLETHGGRPSQVELLSDVADLGFRSLDASAMPFQSLDFARDERVLRDERAWEAMVTHERPAEPTPGLGMEASSLLPVWNLTPLPQPADPAPEPPGSVEHPEAVGNRAPPSSAREERTSPSRTPSRLSGVPGDRRDPFAALGRGDSKVKGKDPLAPSQLPAPSADTAPSALPARSEVPARPALAPPAEGQELGGGGGRVRLDSVPPRRSPGQVPLNDFDDPDRDVERGLGETAELPISGIGALDLSTHLEALRRVDPSWRPPEPSSLDLPGASATALGPADPGESPDWVDVEVGPLSSEPSLPAADGLPTEALALAPDAVAGADDEPLDDAPPSEARTAAGSDPERAGDEAEAPPLEPSPQGASTPSEALAELLAFPLPEAIDPTDPLSLPPLPASHLGPVGTEVELAGARGAGELDGARPSADAMGPVGADWTSASEEPLLRRARGEDERTLGAREAASGEAIEGSRRAPARGASGEGSARRAAELLAGGAEPISIEPLRSDADPGFYAGPGARARLVVEKTACVRTSAIIAASGPLTMEPAAARPEGTTTTEPLGTAADPIYVLEGSGVMLLRVPGTAVALRGVKDLVVAESALVGFDAGFTWESTTVLGLAAVTLRGAGSVLLDTRGAPMLIPVDPDRPLLAARAAILAWSEGVRVARGEGGGGAPRLFRLRGRGYVLLAFPEDTSGASGDGAGAARGSPGNP